MKQIDHLLWIGPQHLACAQRVGGQWLADSLVTEPLEGKDVAPALARLSQRLQAQAEAQALSGQQASPGALRVLVADGHLAVSTLPWSPLVMRQDLLGAMAAGQLAQAGLDVGPGDVIRVDEAGYGQGRLLVAFPQALLDACHALAQAVSVPLASVQPVSAMAWRWMAGHHTLVAGVLADGLALLLSVDQNGGRHPARQLGEVHVRRAPDARAALQQYWSRLRLQHAHAADLPRLPVLDLRRAAATPASDGATQAAAPFEPIGLPLDAAMPDAGLRLLAAMAKAPRPAVDAIQRPGRARWPMLAAAGLLALTSAGLLLDTWQQKQDLAHVQASAQALRPKAQAYTAPLDWTREERAQVVIVNDAIARLNLPMDVLLEALKPPKDIKVSLLSVDIQPALAGGRAVSAIQAQAQSGQDMARYVAFVAQHAPFSAAYLKQHEVLDNEPLRPYRFQMEAVWSR